MFGTVPDFFAQSNKNITIIVQIESRWVSIMLMPSPQRKALMAHFAGPSDLAAALGHLGNASPRTQQTIQHIFARAKRIGKTVRHSGAGRRGMPAVIWNGRDLVAVGSDLAHSAPARRSLP